MQTFRTPVDTREVCEASARYVTADDFPRSVILLALGVAVELKKDTIEAINQAPLLHFGKESMLDEEGRFVAHKVSILGLTGEAAEKEPEKRMFEHARNYKWKWRAETFIQPARARIWRQHQPSLKDLEYLFATIPSFRCPLELFRIARKEGEVRSMPGKFAGHGQAKTAGSPGDDHNLVCQ